MDETPPRRLRGLPCLQCRHGRALTMCLCLGGGRACLLELEAAPWAGRMTAGVRMDGPLSHAGFQMAPTPHLNAECAVISRTRKTKAHETKAEQATHELPVLERGPASFVRQTQTAPLRKEGVCPTPATTGYADFPRPPDPPGYNVGREQKKAASQQKKSTSQHCVRGVRGVAYLSF